MSFEAVIFDLDGTLLDSESQTRTAGERAFASLGIDVPKGFFERLVGVDYHSGMALIHRVWPDLDAAALETAWAVEARELQTADIPLKFGVEAILDHVDLLGLPKAIATSSFAQSARRKLQRTGLMARFETVISVDCVSRPKPAPDPFLLAATRLGANPHRCLAFEDSETGSQSAHAAGMTVVLVPDIAPVTGTYAHHQASDLLQGARMAGLL